MLRAGPQKGRRSDGRLISLVVDEAAGSCYNVRENVCNDGHFFASREAALLWQAAHPHALILSVEEAYQVGKLVEGSRFQQES